MIRRSMHYSTYCGIPIDISRRFGSRSLFRRRRRAFLRRRFFWRRPRFASGFAVLFVSNDDDLNQIVQSDAVVEERVRIRELEVQKRLEKRARGAAKRRRGRTSSNRCRFSRLLACLPRKKRRWCSGEASNSTTSFSLRSAIFVTRLRSPMETILPLPSIERTFTHIFAKCTRANVFRLALRLVLHVSLTCATRRL